MITFLFGGVLLLTCINLASVNSLKFYQAGFSNYKNNNLTILSSNSAPEKNAKVDSNSTLWLLPPAKPGWDNYSSTGIIDPWTARIQYDDPISFLNNISYNNNTNKMKALSFNTSFTFQLITPAESYSQCSSGMAFFISTNGKPPAYPNFESVYFGINANSTTINPTNNPFIAVEFDIYKSSVFNDPSNSHIGMDINSFESDPFLDTSPTTTNMSDAYPVLFLYNNYTFTVWISYNASSELTQVWMIRSSDKFSQYLDPPPLNLLQPILTKKHDLTSIFSIQSSMYIGLSAATSNLNYVLSAAVYSWYFSIDSTNDADNVTVADPPSAVAESPGPAISPSAKSSQINVTTMAVAIGVLLTLALSVCFGIYCYRSRAKHHKPILRKGTYTSLDKSSATSSASDAIVGNFKWAVSLPRHSYKDLQTSTNNFSSVIGEGGFSKVYKGTLPDGTAVAIKRLKDGLRKEAEFTSEIQMINSIRHRYLLQLEGWSYENGEALLVYKFMANGSLERYLFGEKKGTLDSNTRLKILSGIATALEYLHFGLKECILHRDVKAANVLLTEDFDPVVGDFGLARFINHNQSVTATMVGTLGYVAPEIVMMAKVTDKADVYSFGVVALEIACGCQAITKDTNDPQNVVYLVQKVAALRRSERLLEALDPSIITLNSANQDPSANETKIVQDQWKALLELAIICCEHRPEYRPNMRNVSQEIYRIISLSDPQQQVSNNSPSYEPGFSMSEEQFSNVKFNYSSSGQS